MSKERNKKEKNKIKKIKKNCGEDMWHVGMRVGRWGESFPTWIIRWIKEKEGKAKQKEKRKGNKEKRENEKKKRKRKIKRIKGEYEQTRERN